MISFELRRVATGLGQMEYSHIKFKAKMAGTMAGGQSHVWQLIFAITAAKSAIMYEFYEQSI